MNNTPAYDTDRFDPELDLAIPLPPCDFGQRCIDTRKAIIRHLGTLVGMLHDMRMDIEALHTRMHP